jgi:phenylpyruvate tautomerase PptA (4-oxalocrotonate tautomerase family)
MQSLSGAGEAGKADLAERLTKLHSEYATVPRNWVHIVFQEYGVGSGFTAGKSAVTAAFVGSGAVTQLDQAEFRKADIQSRCTLILWPCF